VPEAESFGGHGRNHHPLVVDGQDGIERGPAVQSGDGLHRGFLVGQRHHHGPIAHGLGQRLAVLGADDDLHTQPVGGGHEVRCPIGRSGQEQEDPGHPPILAARAIPRRGHHDR
jgi:hypothetical protein